MKTLIDLYAQTSKHSNYQVLARSLCGIIDTSKLVIQSRYEKERLDYILSKVDVVDKTILDVGGNTGYFTFELCDKGARSIDYYEGNLVHSEFVKEASKVLNVNDRIKVNSEYLMFDSAMSTYNVILLLNVLHHIGDDFGDKSLSIDKAKAKINEILKSLSYKTDILVLQLGFNWKGDKSKGLFTDGTKTEMIDFIRHGIENYWEVVEIGIAEKNGNEIAYNKLNSDNISRDDSLGEFLNRPIFILKRIR